MAEVAPAPAPIVCEACGEPLGLRYWIVDYPRAVHHACRDWSSARWPFGHVEAALRSGLRKGTHGAPARLAMRRLLRELEAARPAWPGRDACEVYEAFESRCRKAMAMLGRR